MQGRKVASIGCVIKPAVIVGVWSLILKGSAGEW